MIKITDTRKLPYTTTFNNINVQAMFMYSGVLYQKITALTLSGETRNAFNWSAGYLCCFISDVLVTPVDVEVLIK